MLKYLSSFAILLCLLTSITFAKDPLIKQAHSGEIVLDSMDLKNGVNIPLIFDLTLKGKMLSVGTISVKRDNNIKTKLREVFTASLNVDVLSIHFVGANIPDAAKYELLVRFMSNDTVVEDVPISVTVPEGIFKIAGPLNVEMTDFFFFNVLKDNAPKLELKESGGVNGLENIPLGPVLMSGNDQAEFGLDFEKSQVNIPAGRSELLRYHVKGNFPLGKSQTTHFITAPGKGNQQSVVVTVENSLTSMVVLVLLVLGIACGTFFRFYIGSRKNLAGLTLEADEILKILAEEKGRTGPEQIEDAPFQMKLEDISATLSTAKKASRIEGVLPSTNSNTVFKETIEQAKVDLQNAENDFAQRKSAFENDTRNFLKVLESNYFLPEAVNDELNLAHLKVKKLSHYVKTLNISEGQKELDALLKKLAERLEKYLKIYNENQQKFAEEPVSQSLPTEVAASLVASQTSIRDMPFSVRNIEEDAQALASRLNEWSANYLSWKTSVTIYVNFYSVYFNRLYQRISAITNLDKAYPKLKGLMAQYIRLVNNPQTYTHQSQDIVHANELETLDLLWQKVFSSLAGVQPDSAVSDEINARNYLGALNLINRLNLKTTPFSFHAFRSPLAINKDWNTKDWFVNLLSTSNGKPAPYPLDSKNREFNPLPARRELENWTWIETVVSALLICVAGYAIFAPTFNGSPANLITVFFSGFSLDITAGSMQEYYKRLKP
jgi:hypothetical protein